MGFWNFDEAIARIKSKLSSDKVTWKLNDCCLSFNKKLRFGKRGKEQCKVFTDFTTVYPLKLFMYWHFNAKLAELFTVPARRLTFHISRQLVKAGFPVCTKSMLIFTHFSCVWRHVSIVSVSGSGFLLLTVSYVFRNDAQKICVWHKQTEKLDSLTD